MFDRRVVFINLITLFLAFFQFFVPSLNYAQIVQQKEDAESNSKYNDQRYLKGCIYEGFYPKQENISKRTRNTKHFENTDGGGAVFIVGLTHYKDNNGKWQDVDFSIKKNSLNNNTIYKYANLTHEIKTWYPEFSGDLGYLMIYNDMQLKWGINPCVNVLRGNNIIATESILQHVAKVNGNKISYSTLSGITEELNVMENGIKGNIIIESLQGIMENIEGDQIAFTEFVPLPNDYKIYIKDILQTTDFYAESFEVKKYADSIGITFAPIITFDSKLDFENAQKILNNNENTKLSPTLTLLNSSVILGTYKVHFVEGGIEVSACVPSLWIQSSERSFPITIDPTLTIGGTASNANSPLDIDYNYHRNQALYLQTELNFAGNITSVAYYTAAATDADILKNTQVWLNHVVSTTTTLAGTWLATGTSVFGSATLRVSSGATTWKEIPFTTSFAYNNSDNLLISIRLQDGTCEYGTPWASHTYNYTATGTNKFQKGSNDATNPPTVAANKFRPYIRISYDPSIAPCPVTTTPADFATGISTSTTLNWSALTPNTGTAATSYVLYFGTDNPPTNIVNGTNIGNVTTYTPASALDPDRYYYWRVAAVNANGTSADCQTRRFYTGTLTSGTLAVDATTYTATQLVNSILMYGGVTATNITFTGNSAQKGSFTGGGSSVGFTDGIILGSGKVVEAIGHDAVYEYTSVGCSHDFGGGGDATLEAIATGTTYDASVLEFDFVPTYGSVSFDYVFGSEEYNNFVNTAYNDAFAFFLSGPNPLGGNYTNKNLAVIPGTSTMVSVNNVNNGNKTQGFCGTGAAENAKYFRENNDHDYDWEIQCNGMTSVLKAQANVTIGSTYHIKLVIADVNDGDLDAWVFLKQNSFNVSTPIELIFFNATCNNDKVNIKWKVATEKNNAFYTIERSDNGDNWQEIGIVNGADNSNTQLNYSYIDENPLEGTSYYRLKQTDFDGKNETFNIVAVLCNNENIMNLNIKPNPASNELTIEINGEGEELQTIFITDLLGLRVLTVSIPTNGEIAINIDQLAKGVYFVSSPVKAIKPVMFIKR